MRQSSRNSQLLVLLIAAAVLVTGFPALSLQAESFRAARFLEKQDSEKTCCGHCGCSVKDGASDCCSPSETAQTASTRDLSSSCRCRVDFPVPNVPRKSETRHTQIPKGQSLAALLRPFAPKRPSVCTARTPNRQAAASVARHILKCSWLA